MEYFESELKFPSPCRPCKCGWSTGKIILLATLPVVATVPRICFVYGSKRFVDRKYVLKTPNLVTSVDLQDGHRSQKPMISTTIFQPNWAPTKFRNRKKDSHFIRK